MRTTVRIEKDLMMDLKARANKEGLSLTGLINRVIRRGLKASPVERGPFREEVLSMGQPAAADLVKALALASALEDEETLRKIALRK